MDMKKILIASALVLGASAPVFAADVAVSINVGEPGFYGQLNIGNVAPPPVINVQPVIVNPVYADEAPIYLRVPPGHAKHWKRYCAQYHACDKRVYFVQDKWYRDEYAPRYRHDHPEHFNEHDDHGDHGHDPHDHQHDGHDKRPWQDEHGDWHNN